MAPPEAGLDDDIGAPALLGIGHLARLDAGQALGGHARPGHDPGELDPAGRAHHQHLVAARLPAGLEQQRDIEHHQLAALAPGPGEEAPLGRAHQRVQDLLQALQRRRIGEDQAAQGDAVDGAVLQHPGKGRGDRGHRLAAAARAGDGRPCRRHGRGCAGGGTRGRRSICPCPPIPSARG